jgi:hypothetical protein
MIDSKPYLVETIHHVVPEPSETDGRTSRLVGYMQKNGGELTYLGHMVLRLPDGSLKHDIEEIEQNETIPQTDADLAA